MTPILLQLISSLDCLLLTARLFLSSSLLPVSLLTVVTAPSLLPVSLLVVLTTSSLLSVSPSSSFIAASSYAQSSSSIAVSSSCPAPAFYQDEAIALYTWRMNKHIYKHTTHDWTHIYILTIAHTCYIHKTQTHQNTMVVQPPPHITLWQKVETKLSYSWRLFA